MSSFQAQFSNHTAFDRYPNVFNTVRSLLGKNDPHDLRILSFGCSTGEEVFCLATKYFPGAHVVGLDVSEEVLDVARVKHSIPGFTTYVTSTPENVALYGPYDLIFGMGVLCRWPDTELLGNISELFSFDTYKMMLRCLHDNLKVGGLLVINGANYQFCDTDLSEMYAIVLAQKVGNNGVVRRFDTRGEFKSGHRGSDNIYKKLRHELGVIEGTFRNISVMNADGVMLGTISISR